MVVVGGSGAGSPQMLQKRALGRFICPHGQIRNGVVVCDGGSVCPRGALCTAGPAGGVTRPCPCPRAGGAPKACIPFPGPGCGNADAELWTCCDPLLAGCTVPFCPAGAGGDPAAVLSAAASVPFLRCLPRWRIMTKNSKITSITMTKIAPIVPASAMIFALEAFPLFAAVGAGVAVAVTCSVFACA